MVFGAKAADIRGWEKWGEARTFCSEGGDAYGG